MKILLMGDASNYHRCLADGLKEYGHDVTVASHGSGWMSTGRDIDLRRVHNKLGGALLWTRLNTTLRRRLSGYDLVNLSSPGFVDLRPGRIARVFDMLRSDNGHLFTTLLGTDSFYVERCLSDESPLRYSEWMVGETPTPYCDSNRDLVRQWLDGGLVDLCRKVYSGVEGAVAALYEYLMVAENRFPEENVAYGGIPIDTASIEFKPLRVGRRINILQACHRGREKEKGADIMRLQLERLAKDFPTKVNYEFVQNLPYDEFVKRLDEAHIVVDQLYSYTPATTALIAMAQGKVVVSGGEPEYYDFIGEDSLKPIVNVDPRAPERLYDDLALLLDRRARLEEMGEMGRRFVEKHNDKQVVAGRFLVFWNSQIDD